MQCVHIVMAKFLIRYPCHVPTATCHVRVKLRFPCRIGRFVGESGAKVEGLHFDHFYGRSLRTFHGRILSYVFRTEGSQRGHRGR